MRVEETSNKQIIGTAQYSFTFSSRFLNFSRQTITPPSPSSWQFKSWSPLLRLSTHLSIDQMTYMLYDIRLDYNWYMWWGGWKGKRAGWEWSATCEQPDKKTHAISKLCITGSRVVALSTGGRSIQQQQPAKLTGRGSLKDAGGCDWCTVHRVVLVIYCQWPT